MNKKIAYIISVVCAGTAILSGCGKTISSDESAPKITQATTTVTAETESTEESSQSEEPVFVPQTEITANKVKFTKFTKTVEAEKCKLSGKAKVAESRKGFSGKGYVKGISQQSDFSANITVPAEQYYDVTISVSADKLTKCGFAVNGKRYSEFSTGSKKAVKKDKGKFVSVSFKGIFLEKGEVELSFIPEENSLAPDIDKITVESSKEAENINLTLEKPELSNKKSDKNAQKLYKFLCDNYGKKVILAQHDSVGTSAESDLIYKTTGKHPAIRFGDMKMFTEADYTEDNEIPTALKWASDGGIVAYMWHWDAPSGGASCYSDSTDFDLSKAVTKEDISQKSIEELEKMEKKGKISAECVALVKDIDTISKQLAILRDNGVAVIWRPLHEASIGTFWWGTDVDSYKWLWNLMYNRQTKYHNLTNLVWVWSAQNAGWYVGDNYCDVLSVDIYNDADKSGQINNLMLLKSICKNKPSAISECGSFPEIQSIADEGAYWSFIGQWGGDYVMNEDGTLSEKYNSADTLKLMYNNNLVITREDLGNMENTQENEETQSSEKDISSKTEKAETTKTTKNSETKQNAQTSGKSRT